MSPMVRAMGISSTYQLLSGLVMDIRPQVLSASGNSCLGARTKALGTATDKDFGVDIVDGEVEGEESGHAGGGVVAGPAFELGELADDVAGLGVEEDGTVVGEEEDVAVGGEVGEGVKVVFLPVGGFFEEGQGDVRSVGLAGKLNILVPPITMKLPAGRSSWVAYLHT
ncbi:uncharacterized protein A4U43_C05F19340 [Asparagus officinalis]|uniref:Uncharacterized protein n=1 Tax=Asparagus officinalis TaxID=4686 RepID=A0A5P1ESS4_ASPOF|nr:uncharacterized protein A4U43_C05F19340 [Asparagus officinalis]